MQHMPGQLQNIYGGLFRWLHAFSNLAIFNNLTKGAGSKKQQQHHKVFVADSPKTQETSNYYERRKNGTFCNPCRCRVWAMNFKYWANRSTLLYRSWHIMCLYLEHSWTDVNGLPFAESLALCPWKTQKARQCISNPDPLRLPTLPLVDLCNCPAYVLQLSSSLMLR